MLSQIFLPTRRKFLRKITKVSPLTLIMPYFNHVIFFFSLWHCDNAHCVLFSPIPTLSGPICNAHISKYCNVPTIPCSKRNRNLPNYSPDLHNMFFFLLISHFAISLLLQPQHQIAFYVMCNAYNVLFSSFLPFCAI